MEQTFNLKMTRHTNIILKREKLDEDNFLEFGKHKNGNYEYVSLLKGNINYFGAISEKHQELFFAVNIRGIWRVLSSDLVSYVKDFRHKKDALKDLRKLAEKFCIE